METADAEEPRIPAAMVEGLGPPRAGEAAPGGAFRLRRAGRLLALAGMAALLARAGMLLARDPCLGVADNLDYWRVAAPAGIEVAAQPRQGRYVVCSYPLGRPDLAGAFSSPALLAWMARPLGRGLGVPPGRFDLRQVGLLYWLLTSALLATAAALGLRAPLALLLAWVASDPGYLLFFNSLYADPALLVGLVGVAALMPLGSFERAPQGPRRRLHRGLLILLVGLAALASASKMQYSPFALALAAAYGAAALACRRRPTAVQGVFLLALAAIGLAAPWHFLRGSGPRFLDANNYNAVYGGIARVASAPDRALDLLGIPPGRRAGSTRDYFAARVQPGDPVLRPLRRLSRLRLARAYLGDPGALGRTADAVVDILRRVRSHPRGNYTRAESDRRARARAYETPLQYSRWRARLLRALPGPAVWVLLGAIPPALAYRAARRRWGPLDTLVLFLALWTLGQMATALLGEGFVNLHQHLVGARLGLDLLLVTLLALALGGRRRPAAPAAPGFNLE